MENNFKQGNKWKQFLDRINLMGFVCVCMDVKEIESKETVLLSSCDKDQNWGGRERMDVRDISQKNQ